MPFSDIRQPELARFQSTVTAPADFDAFWVKTLAEARAQGTAMSLVPVESPISAFETFDVTFPGFAGDPVRGWLVLPRGRAGRVPLVVEYVGYGGGRGFSHEKLHWAALGYAYFRMDTRGQGSTWSRGDTADPHGSDPAHPGYMTRGILSPETYYYRRVYTDAVRAIDCLVAHAAIDPARVAVVGGSQGGAISLAAAALHGGVAALMPDVPYLCDFPRAVRTALRDPFLEIARYLTVHRDRVAQVFATTAYFDGVNMARKCAMPALFSVALMDDICPPSTVFGAYNALQSADRTINEYEFNNHEGGGPYQEAAQMTWLRARFG
jgi:cephalosporin-C deacetylase